MNPGSPSQDSPVTPAQATQLRGAPKREYVREMFDRIATTYDLANLLISGGQTSLWRNRALRDAAFQPGQRVLDIGCGTGLMLRSLKAKYRQVTFEGMDISQGMLTEAHRRDPSGVYFEGDVCSIPSEEGTYDWVTTMYTLRNFPGIEEAVNEVLRVLKPGGRFLVLDAFPSEGPRLWRSFHEFWLRKAIPFLVRPFGDREAYQYLGESILRQIKVGDFRTLIEEAGAKVEAVRSHSLGTAYSLVAVKPLESGWRNQP